MKKSLLKQVYPVYLGIIFLSVMTISLFAFTVFRNLFEGEFIQSIRQSGTVLTNIIDHTLFSDPRKAEHFSDNAASDTGLYVTVLNKSGHAIGDSKFDLDNAVDFSARPEIKKALAGETALAIRKDVLLNGRWVFYAVPFFRGDRIYGVLRTAGTIDSVNEKLTDVLGSVIFSALVLTAVTALLSYFIVGKINEPLALIQEAAAQFGKGELDYRIRIDSPLEIRNLADTLNSMAQELQQRIETISSQRNELEAILSSMIESVIVLDDEMKIRSMNRAAYELLDKPFGEGIGKTLLEFVRNSELDDFVHRTFSDKQAIEDNITLYNHETRHLQVHGSTLAYQDSGRSGVLLVMSDITRIKQLEDLRRDFVANVSHELKTPITSIKGFVETLKDGAIDEPETAKHFLQIIENHSERLHLIIEDLLSLSRLEQFERSIQFNECLIGEIINSVKEVCEPKARAKAIQIKDNYSGSARIIGNANLLEQALINLIDNAIKYSSNNSRIEVNVATKSKLLKIEVHDHGQGIPQRDLPRIFERFYRVDRARSRDMGGTGLGLAIVKHIVLAHNGEIRVESTIGAGSNFIISIPQPPNSYGYT